LKALITSSGIVRAGRYAGIHINNIPTPALERLLQTHALLDFDVVQIRAELRTRRPLPAHLSVCWNCGTVHFGRRAAQ